MFDVTPYTTDRETACGPTCLQMLLDYYGITVDQQTLIDECDVDVSGCSGADLLRVGRLHGLEDIRAYSMDAAELIQQDRPAIVWWKYSHWIVFAGRTDAGDIMICNPSSGRYPIDAGTFSALYSGVSLWNGEPEPVPDADPGDYGERIAALEDELEATKIILGVE